MSILADARRGIVTVEMKQVAAIGAAISSSLGADLICYVTPAEHLALPTPEEVYEGVMSSRIAAHIGDMVKLRKTRNADLEMGHARRYRRLHDVRGLLCYQDCQPAFQILTPEFIRIFLRMYLPCGIPVQNPGGDPDDMLWTENTFPSLTCRGQVYPNRHGIYRYERTIIAGRFDVFPPHSHGSLQPLLYLLPGQGF